ncbi:ribonuclease H-like domain, reverse transcriptase, RNA-dependent DNA polymerase [Tanacetum coccineum]
MTRVNMFVDKDTELVKESSKKAKAEMAQESSSRRAGEELEQEVAKKQKIEDDKEKEDLKQCFEIVQDDKVAIDAIPLATKPAPIKLVKAKHGNTRPEEGYKRVLWGDLKTMFKHHVEDLIWRNLQGKKVLLWRLYDSCGIHFVRFEDMHVYMLVKKRYPLTPATITDMLNKKLQADYWNEIFIEDFSKIANPPTVLTQKSRTFDWGEEQENAFQTLKDKLCNAYVLTLLDGPEDFVVYCDASGLGLGCVLMQRGKVIV